MKMNENKNVLAGLRCPRCGASEPFDIAGRAIFTVYDDGSDTFHSLEWDDDCICSCIQSRCRHEAPLREFKIGAKRTVTLNFEDGETLELEVEYSSPLAVSGIWDIFCNKAGE
jgi:hypothetical protein